ncbi:MAG TPA: N-acetyltransferase [Micromonosporaceae bacterium]
MRRRDADERADMTVAGHVRVVAATSLVADARFVAQAHALLADLVAGGAALGWVDPPSASEVRELLREVAREAACGDAYLVAALEPDATEDRLVGLGYWRRYARPTHRPHADLEKVAVARDAQGAGLGRRLVAELIESARAAGVEVLTLDARGDNEGALRLYRGLGFREYGRLPNFVAVGARRYDKVFYAIDLRP